MEGYHIEKRDELLEACHDLRLPIAGNENVETLELYIQAAYDDFENNDNSSSGSIDSQEYTTDEGIDYGSIGDKSWWLKYLINKILFFL